MTCFIFFLYCFFSDEPLKQGTSQPPEQSWKEVEKKMYFLEFPSARGDLQHFFTEALSQSNPDIQKLTLPQPSRVHIDKILNYEQPTNLSISTPGISENLDQQHESSFDPSVSTSSPLSDSTKQKASDSSVTHTSFLSSSYPDASSFVNSVTEDRALAELLYKYFELGYLTCQYQLTHRT